MAKGFLSTNKKYPIMYRLFFTVVDKLLDIKYNEKVEKLVKNDRLIRKWKFINETFRKRINLEDYRDFSPAPVPTNETRRLEAVRKTGVMDVANEELFLIYTELAKEISNMPVSYTGLIDQKRQYM